MGLPRELRTQEELEELGRGFYDERACTPVPVGAVIPRMYLPACRRSADITPDANPRFRHGSLI
jgi:hypothetical protein